jgi:hypothetical protein
MENEELAITAEDFELYFSEITCERSEIMKQIKFVHFQ